MVYEHTEAAVAAPRCVSAVVAKVMYLGPWQYILTVYITFKSHQSSRTWEFLRECVTFVKYWYFLVAKVEPFTL